jgi:NADH-quinone oxidoreductase subunit C
LRFQFEIFAMTPFELAQRLKAQFGEVLAEPTEFRDETTVKLADASKIADVCAFAKRSLGFDMLLDISSVDNHGEDPRWTVVYELYSLSNKTHLRLKTEIDEESSELPSVTGVWKTADWHEREIYDMMGLRFTNHPDLRRILMWEGYPYFPLRKDFPLAGKSSEMPEVAFSEPAPLQGGPFVTISGGKDAVAREPRTRTPDADIVETNARLERRRDVIQAHAPEGTRS